MITTVPSAPMLEIHRPYQPYGAALEVLYSRDPEIVLSGPAGTGKTRGNLEKLFLVAEKYARCRILIVRKTRVSLAQSVLVTWEEKVVPKGHPALLGPTRQHRTEYKFPNGSIVAVAGMDEPTRILSTEWDIIYVAEAIELTEEEWETLITRLRNGVVPYQQIIGDTNPDGPRHWLYLRAQRGALRMLESRHEDNPAIWDKGRNCPTPAGAAYLARLDALTGVRYLRFRLGKWVQAEGVVYPQWDPRIHRITLAMLPTGWESFPRIWGVDFGFNHPFVWQEWLKAPDGDLFRLREIFKTKTLVEDHCREINAVRTVKPTAVVCDHDAEGRATLERHLGVKTIAANKAVSAGIQAVSARLGKPEEGGVPAVPARLFYVQDGLIHPPDENLIEQKHPTCTEEEYDSYIWDVSNGRKRGEEPVKRFDDGMDVTRYVVAYVDEIHRGGPKPRFRPIGS